VSVTGPYNASRRRLYAYGDVRPLLNGSDDKFAVFGSGDEVALDFDPATLPALPQGWVRDYFFAAHGYEKDMDFYAYRGETIELYRFVIWGRIRTPASRSRQMPNTSITCSNTTRVFMSGNEAGGYSFPIL